jgi:hypothetical protein
MLSMIEVKVSLSSVKQNEAETDISPLEKELKEKQTRNMKSQKKNSKSNTL